MRRIVFVFAGWTAGWLVYMIAMMMTVYDGILSLIFQPFMAALFSGVFTAAALLGGLLLRISALGRAWKSHNVGPLAMIGISLFVLCFGSSLGWTQTVDGENGVPAAILRADLAVSAYLGLIFAIVNWPLRD